jgi:hypothetical protein
MHCIPKMQWNRCNTVFFVLPNGLLNFLNDDDNDDDDIRVFALSDISENRLLNNSEIFLG